MSRKKAILDIDHSTLVSDDLGVSGKHAELYKTCLTLFLHRKPSRTVINTDACAYVRSPWTIAHTLQLQTQINASHRTASSQMSETKVVEMPQSSAVNLNPPDSASLHPRTAVACCISCVVLTSPTTFWRASLGVCDMALISSLILSRYNAARRRESQCLPPTVIYSLAIHHSSTLNRLLARCSLPLLLPPIKKS
jgi:hypothetical protein